MDTNPDARWVVERLNALEPTWVPDPSRAHAALRSRLERKRLPMWALAVPAVAAACLAVVLMPQTRAAAQEIWARWTVGRLAVVHVGLPADWHIKMQGAMKLGVGPGEAADVAGYTAELPTSSVGAEQPELSVLSTVELSQTIDVASIREALRRVGATDVQVPDSWDAFVLRAEVGPTVVAEYPDGAVIAQTKPFPLYVPVGMPLTDIANVIFRSAGVPAAEAKAMALAYAIQPAWFLDVAKDEKVRIEQMTLSNGPAIVIEALDASITSVERVTVLRSTPDRLFMIVGPTRERALTLAQGLK